jgi:hypothetical protein
MLHESHDRTRADQPRPTDAVAGQWSRARLEAMDQRSRERMRKALSDERERERRQCQRAPRAMF